MSGASQQGSSDEQSKALDEQSQAFWKKVRQFREGLPPAQGEALDLMIANAAKAAIVAQAARNATARGAATDRTSDDVAFATALAGFRGKLSPDESAAFEAIVAAGASQDDGNAVVYLGNLAFVAVYFAICLGPPLGLAIVAGITSHVEETAADLSGTPTSPEEV